MVAASAAGHPEAMNTTTTHIPEIRRLQRSRSDRKVAGVSGGLARYFEIHPAVFRVGFVVLTLLGGAGILIYAAAALDIATLPHGAARSLVIVSAQFGALRANDRVPVYRREMDAAYWRAGLQRALDEATAGRLLVDCRSSTYVAAWRPSREVVDRRVQVSVAEERDGARRVVSHMAKKTRGEVARHLLVSGAKPRTPAELADAVAERFTCELEPPVRRGAPFTLTVVQS